MERLRPWFIADWQSAVFIHFRVDLAKLQRLVPYQLDAWQGDGIISLVAFTQARLRPARFGGLAEWLSAPLARHEFLNLRTYIRNGSDRGIFFLAEWIPNRLAALIGPAAYGLPYRLGQLRYSHDIFRGMVSGKIKAGLKHLSYRGLIDRTSPPKVPAAGSLADFLVERYTAYTCHNGISRRFRIAHAPWEISEVNISLQDTSLLDEFSTGLYPRGLIAAHYSNGVQNVQIGGPERQTSIEKAYTLMKPRPCGERYVQSQC